VSSQLAVNLVRFARLLRAAGLPAGTGRVLEGLRAVEAVGVESRAGVYHALRAVFVGKRADRELFDEAFRSFFRAPDVLDPALAALLGQAQVPLEERAEMTRRLAEAMGVPAHARAVQPVERLEIDATLTWSDREVLRKKDFEQMSAGELARARAAVARLRLPLPEVAIRRFRPDAAGSRIDLRATLRAASRGGFGQLDLRWRTQRKRPPPLVCLCDISGSMERYTRVLLGFVHALTGERARVHTFLFGTRLTDVTRHLRRRDVDVALARVSAAVADWGGGTRIGACLAEFNRRWSRRVLSGAVVLLVTDGLDREGGAGLAAEMARLHRSCRRLVWLNPLLRYAGFEPRAAGVKAILPHVDEHRPVHNLESLEQIVEALSGGRTAGGRSGRSARPSP
jgi:uncharacterized protein with von Willebrand factor type A (vWA) domain